MRLVRAILNGLSPAGPNGRLSILILHRVQRERDELFPDELDAAQFDRLCGWLCTWYQVLPLDVAVQRLAAGSLPARALAITFDDGYADNHDVALPILRRHALPAAFFVATGFLDGGCMWNDVVIESLRRTALPVLDLRDVHDGLGRHETATLAQRRVAIEAIIGCVKYLPQQQRQAAVEAVARRAAVAPPDTLMMRCEQVVALRRAGMQIGAHTVTHPILAGLPATRLRDEIDGSKRFLERLLGERVGLFAYPNGTPDRDFDAACVAAVAEAGFDAAVTTAWGAACRASDRLQLPRFMPWDRTPVRFAARMSANLWRSRRARHAAVPWLGGAAGGRA